MADDRDTTPDDVAGEERIGHYRILAQLGQDELGLFLGAVDERLDRLVVLRVSRPVDELGEAAKEVWARMREGARVASHLNHPNLVTVYEYLPLHDAELVALEQVEGDTLEQLHLRGERFTVLDVARMLARLADAVAAAHSEGIAHGRIGLANVKIRPDGRVKLLDLGLPRELGDDGRVLIPDPEADVRGLAALACELLAPPGAEAAGWPVLLADPVRARAAFGFLAPVLARALAGPDGAGFASAAEFRDSLLLALESAAGRASGMGGEGRGVEPSFSTRVIGPSGAVGDALPEDGHSLAALGRVPFSTGRTRLALPPDLAERVPPDLQNRVGTRRPLDAPPKRRPFGFRRPTVLAAGVVAVVLATFAVLQTTRGEPGETESGAAPSGAGTGGGDPVTAAPDPAATDTTLRDSVAPAAASRPLVSARVRVTPSDAAIRIAGQREATWRDGAELEVTLGDTILLEFSRPGYVTTRVPFSGSRVSVTLLPDSVSAVFEANVRADVFLVTNGREALVGTTNLTRRLPSGTHRFVFRSPGQPDWQTQVAMSGAGQTYRVARTDYITLGSLVATVVDGWAMASLDGGLARETPASWNDIPVGRHVLTLVREGYRTVVDTVTVPAGQLLRRRYTLQRQP